MNPTTTPTSEFILRRLREDFPQFMSDLWGAVPIPLLVLAALAVVARVGYARYYRKTHGHAKPDATSFWLGWAAIASVGALALWVLVAFYKEDTERTRNGSPTLTALSQSNAAMWYAFVAGVFALGAFYVVLMYVKDSRSVRWFWAVKLAVLRTAVYAILCFVFLLPAKQTWERTEKRSRVVVLIDISPSMTRVSDEVGTAGGKKPKTRMDHLIEFLSDKDVALVQNILKTNPVVVYPFGTRLDDSPRTIERDAGPWGQAEWQAFAAYDFRPFLLDGLSPEGRQAIQNTTNPVDWNGPKSTSKDDRVEATNWADWAGQWFNHRKAETLVNGMTPEDTQTLRANLEKLERRIDVARSIALGTNVPDSIGAALDREAPNRVQGVIVFSDMRSNLGSDTSYRELRARVAKEKIPVFTIAVGEDRQSSSIVITDIQVSDVVSPDDGFPVTVEADGWNLAGKTVNVELDLFLPDPNESDPSKKRDLKTAKPDYTLKGRKNKADGAETPYTLNFAPGDPPHGQVEFTIDPAQLAADPDPKARALVTESTGTAIKKMVLKEGKWAVRARIAKDEHEAFAEAEHSRERDGIQVIQKPLRVLLVSSATSREFQFLRTFLAREVKEKRATLTLLVQNEAGKTNTFTLGENEQIIGRFPTKLDLSGKSLDVDKPYNLNEYDVIVAFDPDWSELSREQAEDFQNWVERQGGGFVFVADRINTIQLARVEKPKPGVEPTPETRRLMPILEMLPVDPDDPIAIVSKGPSANRYERRLYLHPLPDSDLLKIDETQGEKGLDNDPVGGWERYFMDRDKYVDSKGDDKIDLNPRYGFYSCYPVREVKAGAKVLAEFVNEGFDRQKTLSPWLVMTNPDAPGRVLFMASGEIYRMQKYQPPTGKELVDRYWAKVLKYMAAKRNVKAPRGRVLVSKEVVSGMPIRVQAQLLNSNSKPYPANANIDTKFKVQRVDIASGEKKVEGPYPLTPTGVEGYYKGQVAADLRLFPPGENYEYSIVVDVPESTGDTLTGKFSVMRSDLEMNMTKPDFAMGLAMAGDYNAAFQEQIPEKVKAAFGSGLPRDNGVPKLALKLSDRELIKLIPDCFRTDPQSSDIRGPVHDLWDKGLPETLANADSPALQNAGAKLGEIPGQWQKVSWVLFVVVFLLCWEWLTRKLLRLA